MYLYQSTVCLYAVCVIHPGPHAYTARSPPTIKEIFQGFFGGGEGVIFGNKSFALNPATHAYSYYNKYILFL